MCSLHDAHAEYASAYGRLLDAIREVDEATWRRDGSTSLAAWVASEVQVSYATAARWVRDASALSTMHDLGDALSRGEVSEDQLRAVVALTADDPSADGAWVDALRHWSIAELQHEARKATARRLERRDHGRYLTLEHTPDERYVRIHGQVHPEEGAVLMKAIDRAIPDDIAWFDHDRHRVDGLLALARTAIAADADPDRATVVVHVTDDEVAELDSGGFVTLATADRLGCDARVETVEHAMTTPVGIGRASRNVPAFLYRQLRHRDRTCVFPSCERRGYLHAHHITHWRHGGRTDLDNLVLVCTSHHTLLHEGGWSVLGPAGPSITFLRPDGRPFRAREPAPP